MDVHREVIGEVFLSIAGYVKKHRLGKVRIAPYDVYLDAQNAFQPDIVFVSTERLHTPDLIVEILSPATSKLDKQQKKNVYERCGVKEYWIIDPTDRSVYGYELVDNTFRDLPLTYGVLESRLLHTAFNF